jgi:hypothetical protein
VETVILSQPLQRSGEKETVDFVEFDETPCMSRGNAKLWYLPFIQNGVPVRFVVWQLLFSTTFTEVIAMPVHMDNTIEMTHLSNQNKAPRSIEVYLCGL